MSKARLTATASLILALYVILAAWKANTTYPWANEAWFASPALNLAQKGFMGTTILESKGTWMEGMDRHTYWILPLHILAQTAWYKLFGFSLLTLRWLSIFWGAVILIAWYALMLRLSGDHRIALLTAGLLAVDGQFIFVASLGRMDAMCAGLGWAGCAAFVCLRERSLGMAIFAGNALVAASSFTHPCGALYFVALAAITIYCERRGLGWREVALAATPYLAGLGAWGIYILQSPAQFWSQFSGNASGIAGEFTEYTRWSGLTAPVYAFKREIQRYLAAYSWYEASTFWWRFRAAILVIYALGILAAIETLPIRRHAGYRVLMLAGGIFYVLMMLFEGLKASTYLVHTLPIAAALLAVSIVHYAYGPNRRLALAALAFMVAFQLAYGVGLNRGGWRWDYAAAIGFLKQHSTPSSQIIGGGELAFSLGFDANLIDDPRLGYYSGKQPDFIVANSVYRGWINRSQARYPAIHQHLEKLLETRYREVFHNRLYTIYQAGNPGERSTPTPNN
ncbi:MAG: hypothetical protein HYX25_07745 [Candidatus Solibacter usitatus]|nr:hypothetical protein [Candidatus Solibacter usitatus]